MSSITMSGAGLRIELASRFLSALGDRFTFQTFDDSPSHDRRLTRVFHGSLQEHAEELLRLNAAGAGIFVMVNAGDCRGRRTSNVRAVRAYFVDLDGAPIEPVLACPAAPHIVVQSSPGRWHAYWLVESAPLATFSTIQAGLAARFDADPKVRDLPRVMRLPGFDHQKGSPFTAQIEFLREGPHYQATDLEATLELRSARWVYDRSKNHARDNDIDSRITSFEILEGQRNVTLYALARSFMLRGFDAHTVLARIQKANEQRCKPPLRAEEVDRIVRSASSCASSGFIRLPHSLIDSREWKELDPCERDIIQVVFRRYNGRNNGNIALPWHECKWIRGCGDQNRFYRHRSNVVAAGLLRVSKEGRQTREGRTPDLFAIPDEWLPSQTTAMRTQADQ